MILNIRDNNSRKVYLSESQCKLLVESSRYNSVGFEMLVGIPGCGKSTYLRKLDNKDVVIVCPDDIRRELTGNISDQSRNGDVWNEAERRIIDGLSSGSYVILDATNVNTRMRVGLLGRIKGRCNVPCYATVFECNPDVSKERIANDIKNGVDRSNVPPEVIDRMYGSYLETLKVLEDEGFDGVFYYGGSNEGRILTEAEWNLHYGEGSSRTKAGYGYGRGGGHTLEPYKTDNKFVMPGRDTGHFGSGTYFSTYKYENREKSQEILDNSMDNQDPHFIQIGDGVYRVDFDLYKNLYRVRSARQGNILFTMMINLNRMYNRICRYQGRFNNSEAIYDNATLYQIIKRNAEGLGLRCPSYYQLTRMAQEHGKNDDAIQSFSTLFMEWNGYNGVNVSGIEEFDNTLHGSVIYDLSKTNTTMEPVSPKNLYIGTSDRGHTSSIVSNGYIDPLHDSLDGKDFMFLDKLNDMPLPQAMRALKNYCDSGQILSPFEIESLDDNIARRYLRMVYVKKPRNYWYDCIADEFFGYKQSRRYIELIEKYGAYYWVNYYETDRSGRYVSGLVNILDNFDSNHGWWRYDTKEEKMAVKKQYLDKLLGYMTRELEEDEKKYIEEEYFYEYGSSEDE